MKIIGKLEVENFVGEKDGGSKTSWVWPEEMLDVSLWVLVVCLVCRGIWI